MEQENFTEEVWSDAQINQGLRQLPSLIAYHTQQSIEAEDTLKTTKHLITLAEAAVKVAYSEKTERVTATELNAMAYKETAELHEQYIKEEKQLELAKARLQYFRDLFDSCRKAANLRIEESRRLEGTYDKRHRPQGDI